MVIPMISEKIKKEKMNKYLVVFDRGEGGEKIIRARSDQEAIDKAVELARTGNWKFEWEEGPKEVEIETWIFRGETKDDELIFDKDIIITVK